MEQTNLEDNLITIEQYANQKGIKYEAVRQQISNTYKDDPDLQKHIHKIGRTRFLDPDAVKFLDSKRSKDPIYIEMGENRIKELELENAELREDRDRQRDEKEAYMKQLLEFQQKGIDTTKYIALEDHRKTEEALKEKEEEIESLKKEKSEVDTEVETLREENEQLREDSLELRKVTIRVSKLNNEIEEKRSLLEQKNNEMLELQKKNVDIEAEKRKAKEKAKKKDEEAQRIEEELNRQKQENIDNMSLSIRAYLKKRKAIRKQEKNKENKQ